jgi:HlyD family secretion protein
MSKTKKIVIGSAAALVVAIGAFGYYKAQEAKITKVQTGKVVRMDSLVQTVSASGEIKPLKFINITANSFGRIVDIAVKEGDHVREGDLLLKQESVQSSADLRSAQALLQQLSDDQEGLEAAYHSAEATLRAQQAELVRSQADLEKARLDFERSQNLLKEGLISKSEFDQAQAAFAVARATTDSARSRIQQFQAQLNQADKARIAARSRIAQQRASIARVSDQVNKTVYQAPLTGVITNLPVHVGESAVPGIQNSIGSNLMTLADLSVITAEVKVDETDIVNVKLDQEAEVTVDAIPNKTFKGKVTEVGSSALTRTTGQAAGAGMTPNTTTSQEAKDFKVVVTLLEPSSDLKPGLSTTSKIMTAARSNVLAIPIQALTIREVEKEKEKEEPKTTPASPGTAKAAGNNGPPTEGTSVSSRTSKKKEQQGVFILRDGKAFFVPVTTGITGQTEIEVLSGLREGDEIITGSYKTLRTIKTDTEVRVDNEEAGKDEKKE